VQASLKAQAIRLLARREYPRVELEQRLMAKGGDREAVKDALDDLARTGLLSDVRYAEALVRQKAGGYSRHSIARILKHKGVDPQIVQEVLEPLAVEDDCEQARVLWMRRFGSLPTNDRERARQVRFLVSRGYSVDIALRVLRLVKSTSDE
jgi:regulatory protein